MSYMATGNAALLLVTTEAHDMSTGAVVVDFKGGMHEDVHKVLSRGSTCICAAKVSAVNLETATKSEIGLRTPAFVSCIGPSLADVLVTRVILLKTAILTTLATTRSHTAQTSKPTEEAAVITAIQIATG